MHNRNLFIVMTLLVAGWASSATAEGWSWLPFAQREETTHRTSVKSAGGIDNAMLDGKHLKRSLDGEKTEPSLMSKMGTGVKSMYTKTVDVFTPDKPDKPISPAVKPVQKTKSKSSVTKSRPKAQTGADERPQTVDDFFRNGKRIQP